jgi:hypothetical protein
MFLWFPTSLWVLIVFVRKTRQILFSILRIRKLRLKKINTKPVSPMGGEDGTKI